MTEKHTKLKICIDVAACAFLVYPIYYGIWARNYTTPIKPMPVQIVLLLCDIIPFLFGYWWLLSRYKLAAYDKYPRLKNFMEDKRVQIGVIMSMGILGIYYGSRYQNPVPPTLMEVH